MDKTEILSQLERGSETFPRAAVEAAVAQREEITPDLLRILEDSVDRAPELDAQGDYMGHLYAMFLLAQFRETRAYPLVVRFLSLPGDLLDSLGGDFVTQFSGRILASVCGGELAGIQSLIENEAVDEWVRGAALASLVTLVVVKQKSREEIVDYFGSLFRGKLVREWSHVWDALVGCTTDLYPAELLDDIRRAYEEELVDPGHAGFDEVEQDLAEGRDRILSKLADNPHRRLVDDTVAEMSSWAYFREDTPANSIPDSGAGAFTFKRAAPKVGRNEPCPCGSGKKFKKCCLHG